MKKIFACVLSLAVAFTLTTPIFASSQDLAASTNPQSAVKNYTIDVSKFSSNPVQTIKGVDQTGHPYTITIKKIAPPANAPQRVSAAATGWHDNWYMVSQSGALVSAQFLMETYGPHCLGAQQSVVTVVVGSYLGKSLTYDYNAGTARLAFTYNLQGWASVDKYLKGTVTNNGNSLSISSNI